LKRLIVQRLKGVDVGEGLDVGNSNCDLNEDSDDYKDDDSDYGDGDTDPGLINLGDDTDIVGEYSTSIDGRSSLKYDDSSVKRKLIDTFEDSVVHDTKKLRRFIKIDKE
jgi:hypothetical protein